MMLRIEAGLPLIDVEWHNSRLAFTDHDRVTPKELGMGWMLRGVARRRPRLRRRRRDPPRAGRRSTSRWTSVGDRRRLGGLGPAAPRRRPAARRRTSTRCGYESVLHDRPTTAGGSQVGYVTSFFYSPVLQRHVGLARVRPDLAAPGTEVHLELALQPPQHDGARAHREAAPVQPREEDGQGMTVDRHSPTAATVRRDRGRRRPQRPGQRRLPRQGGAAHPGARAARPRRRRRDHRGAACPGFSFTTFSYALSLLRPEIIHELDLVKHGFMPLMMPSSFHPTGDGDYLLLGDDHGQNIQEIRRHSPPRRRRLRPLPPRPRPGRARRSSRCSTTRRPTSSARTPRTRPTSRGCSTTSAASSRR